MSTKSKTVQTNQYKEFHPSDTRDTIALREQIGKAYDTADPTIPYTFARRREAVGNRFGSPFGANYSPETRDAMKYNDMNEIDQEQGMANRMDSFNRRQAKTQALAGLANHTQGRYLQTQGTSVQSQPLLPSIIGAGAAIGSAFI